ncbi:unnamed protein product [Musa acuminata subsp. malaccensis]|uniref:(wild Malaysian banana) hypothetical protein n=1 Tax=Musa acuminata subsp. malaccensis TaxID=214687 RepID=A0A8D7ADR5_MUSAM|nr:unnamed protein product [Musa acuminata subsp. malaccensis]
MQSDLGKLFIGGISWDTNEDRLREYFRNYGEVVEAVIMKDRTTGRARGFGFIVFADPAVAERVVMEKHLIDGRMVEAKKAVPRDDQQILNRNNSSVHGSPGPGGRTKKIFVGGLPSTLTESDFKKYFDQFGTITDVVVMYDHNTQRPRGFGFITYDSEDAVDRVLFKSFHELNGKMVEVKRAVPKELSPGPNIRSPSPGYNYGLNRANSFLNGYTQGYNPSLISGYGMRMDGRLGPISARNGFTSFGPGFGMGMNFEPSLIPSFGGNSSFSNNIGYGRGLSPYYSANSTRYSSPIGYGGGSANASSGFSSVTRNAWSGGDLNYGTNSASSNAYMASGNGSLGGFGNSTINWGSATPISAQVGGGTSSYTSGNLNFGGGDNNFDLGGGSFGRSTGPSVVKTSLSPSSGGFEGSYAELYGGSSVYGDPTWRSSSSELGGTGSFGYGLGTVPSDIIGKGSAGYVGDYNATNRQPNRGKQFI